MQMQNLNVVKNFLLSDMMKSGSQTFKKGPCPPSAAAPPSKSSRTSNTKDTFVPPSVCNDQDKVKAMYWDIFKLQYFPYHPVSRDRQNITHEMQMEGYDLQ